jgi:hypothetical protein
MTNNCVAPLLDFEIMRVKDIMNRLKNIGERAAGQLYRDIKEHFGVRVVLGQHFKQYFKVQ